MTKRYKPLIDKLYWILFISTNILCAFIIVLPCLLSSPSFIYSIPITLFINYFLVSPLFGYVELRESEIFIKYGFILKRSIEYKKIRTISKQRKWYSESMLSLKSALEHVDIKYNSFDITAVSVKDNDDLIREIEKIRALAKEAR